MTKQTGSETKYDSVPTSMPTDGDGKLVDPVRYEQTPERENWARKIDFLLACIGFSVGLGNVWRFPYLCYKNGGGAFLVPYFLFVIVGGVPMFYLEVALGQFMSQGGIKAWNLCPIFKGIGFATTIIVFYLNCYYNVILTWSLRYLFASFQKELPWGTCNNTWNTPACSVSFQTEQGNDTLVNNSSNGNLVDAVTEYWTNKVLRLSDGIEYPGKINWDLALCLLLAWIICYFCIWKGIRTSGKVMYFTATSPYVFMTILLIRGATLPGAKDGVIYYLKPNATRLRDIQTWVDAGTQIFFSYSISLGTLTALGSYNLYHHNSHRDSVIFACCNSGTSFFAGFVIFCTLGFMAHEQGRLVSQVAESGPGLAFVAYPKALTKMPVAPLWSVFFFFMVLLLGLDSQFVGIEGFITALTDIWPHKLRRKGNREIFIAVVCAFSFLVGLSMVTEGGMYVFQIFDYYTGSRIILLVALFECIAIAWVYGIDRFYDDIADMLGFRLNRFFWICWLVLTPLFNISVFALSAYSYSELKYERPPPFGEYVYPQWAIAVGWILAASSIVWVPIVFFWKLLFTESGNFVQRWRILTTPLLKDRKPKSHDNIAMAANYATAPVAEKQPYTSDMYPTLPIDAQMTKL